MRIIFLGLMLSTLFGCSSIDSVYGAGKGIVGGVAADVTAITTGALDTVSGVIKDVNESTNGAE